MLRIDWLGPVLCAVVAAGLSGAPPAEAHELVVPETVQAVADGSFSSPSC